MVEQDVIGHLMDVERQAHDLLVDAQAEADKRKASAKGEAEQRFLAEYEKITAHSESVYDEGRKAAEEKRDREYGQYAEYLGSIPINRKSFNAYLDALLFGR